MPFPTANRFSHFMRILLPIYKAYRHHWPSQSVFQLCCNFSLLSQSEKLPTNSCILMNLFTRHVPHFPKFLGLDFLNWNYQVSTEIWCHHHNKKVTGYLPTKPPVWMMSSVFIEWISSPVQVITIVWFILARKCTCVSMCVVWSIISRLLVKS